MKNRCNSKKESLNKLFGAALMLLFVSVGCFSTAFSVRAQNCTTAKRPLDFDGDGKTDFSVVRNTGGGATGAITWFNNTAAGFSATQFGITTDGFIPADYDGDGKTDIAVWRPGAQAYFYILQSQTNTLRVDAFGQNGDDPSIVGDYTGDGKADPAVYRSGASSGQPSYFYYRPSNGPLAGTVFGTQWGQNGDFPAPGDYDGDGRYDFAVQRNGGSTAIFYLNQTTDGFNAVRFGTSSDRVVPGYYDGDCKTDIAVIRGSGSSLLWYIRNSTNGALQSYTFGLLASDYSVQGDYDGDGLTDIAVWRPNATAGATGFYWRNSTGGTVSFRQWGQSGDYSPGNFNTH